MNKQTSTQGRKKVRLEVSANPGSSVYVAGSFNKWNTRQKKLRRDGGGVFRADLLLPKGRYEYKFIVDGAWQADPGNSDWIVNEHGSLNSVLHVQ